MNLRDARKTANLTLEEVGEKLGVSASTIFQWETGKNSPRVAKIPKIAAIYGLSVGETVLCCQESSEGGKNGQA